MSNEAISEDALLVSVFRLGDAMFGIPAAQIQEVVQMGSVTPVHHAPRHSSSASAICAGGSLP